MDTLTQKPVNAKVLQELLNKEGVHQNLLEWGFLCLTGWDIRYPIQTEYLGTFEKFKGAGGSFFLVNSIVGVLFLSPFLSNEEKEKDVCKTLKNWEFREVKTPGTMLVSGPSPDVMNFQRKFLEPSYVPESYF